jgi:hypothetical protein
VDHGGGRDWVLDLVVLGLAREGVLGEESLPDPLTVDGISWRGTGLVDGVGGELEELLGGKGVVPDV